MYIYIPMILFCYVCGFCCLFCFVFYHGIYCLASQMVATSSNAWASSIQTPRTVQWIWWVCCGCRCLNGDSMDLEHLLSQAIRTSSFFSSLKKKITWLSSPLPKICNKIIKPRCRDWTWNSSVCDRKEWDPLENSGHKGSQGLWPMQWPEASGLKKILPGSFSSKLPLKL